MIQNKIHCNQRRYRLVSSQHSLIHDVDPSFLREDLKHRHERLKIYALNLGVKISHVTSKSLKYKATYFGKGFEFSEVTEKTEELHGYAGGYYQQAHGKNDEAAELLARRENFVDEVF